MNPFLSALWARTLYRITLSKNPEDVEMQQELEAGFKDMAAHPKEYVVSGVLSFVWMVVIVIFVVGVFGCLHCCPNCLRRCPFGRVSH